MVGEGTLARVNDGRFNYTVRVDNFLFAMNLVLYWKATRNQPWAFGHISSLSDEWYFELNNPKDLSDYRGADLAVLWGLV